jgi:hypothetical protein
MAAQKAQLPLGIGSKPKPAKKNPSTIAWRKNTTKGQPLLTKNHSAPLINQEKSTQAFLR